MNEDQLSQSFNQLYGKYIDDAKLYTTKRRVPIWLKLLPIVLFLIVVLSYYHSGYYAYEEDGSYYIAFKGLRLQMEEDHDKFKPSLFRVPTVTFDSAASVRADILAGNFSDTEMSELRRYYINCGPIHVPDFNTLYEPVYTECNGYQVIWGASFYYELDCGDRAKSLYLFLSNSGEMSTFFERCNNLGQPSGNTELIDTYPDPSRNGTVYYFSSPYYSSGRYTIVYKISDEEKTIYVLEEYYDDPAENPPESVEAYGVSNGIYYRLRMTNPKERPSTQWLFSFGLIPLA